MLYFIFLLFIAAIFYMQAISYSEPETKRYDVPALFAGDWLIILFAVGAFFFMK